MDLSMVTEREQLQTGSILTRLSPKLCQEKEFSSISMAHGLANPHTFTVSKRNADEL